MKRTVKLEKDLSTSYSVQYDTGESYITLWKNSPHFLYHMTFTKEELKDLIPELANFLLEIAQEEAKL